MSKKNLKCDSSLVNPLFQLEKKTTYYQRSNLSIFFSSLFIYLILSFLKTLQLCHFKIQSDKLDRRTWYAKSLAVAQGLLYIPQSFISQVLLHLTFFEFNQIHEMEAHLKIN